VSEPAPLYLHVADDGGLLLVDGASGRSSWVTAAEVARQVEGLAAAGGSLLLTRERGSVAATLVLVGIEQAGARIIEGREVHPDAHRVGGTTALMAAAYVGALELVDDLVDRGVDLDACDESGYTALMFAANGEQAEVVRVLLDAGADPDASDRFGNTVLMFAAQHGDTSAIKRLLAAGADATRPRVQDGLRAHDVVEANGHRRAAAILRAAATAAG
jgi:uncharacterized protein